MYVANNNFIVAEVVFHHFDYVSPAEWLAVKSTCTYFYNIFTNTIIKLLFARLKNQISGSFKKLPILLTYGSVEVSGTMLLSALYGRPCPLTFNQSATQMLYITLPTAVFYKLSDVFFDWGCGMTWLSGKLHFVKSAKDIDIWITYKADNNASNASNASHASNASMVSITSDDTLAKVVKMTIGRDGKMILCVDVGALLGVVTSILGEIYY